MTGSHGAAERRPRASAAFAAYRAGNGAQAEAIGYAILAQDPRDAGAPTTSAASSPPTAAPSTRRVRRSRPRRRSHPTRRACTSRSAIWHCGKGTTRQPSAHFAQRWHSRRARQPPTPTSARHASGRGGWRKPSRRSARGLRSIAAPAGGGRTQPPARASMPTRPPSTSTCGSRPTTPAPIRRRPGSPSTMSPLRPTGDSRTTISTRRGLSASWRARRGRRCTCPTAATGR